LPAHSIALLLAKRIDSCPVARAEYDVPEQIRVLELVAAGGSYRIRVRDASSREQFPEGRRRGDLVPRVEGPDQRRLYRADGFPEKAVGGLEQAGSPGSDG
jgi:hypothetical protein